MEKSIVRVTHLSHRYQRDWAIKDINLEIDSVGVLGLLGSNGAGKSTTMNILCGVLNQTEGSVTINGIDISQAPELAKIQLGFLPQHAPLYLDLTVNEYLTHCAYLRNVPRKKVAQFVAAAMDTCGISHYRSRVIQNLSGGYRQRVGIAQAIIHRPKLVVLDEPTNGLDPNQIIAVRQLIKDIARDRAVVFSSHILSEVQATCQEIRMIEGGRMVFSGTMDDFNNYLQPNTIFVRLQTPPSVEVLLQLSGVGKIIPLPDNSFRIQTADAIATARTIVAASEHMHWGLIEITPEKSSLDEIFAQLSNQKPSSSHE